MLKITDEDMGLWLHSSEYRTWNDFYIDVIDLAIENGLILGDQDSWDADKAIIRANVATDDILEEFDNLYTVAFDHLQNILPDRFFFTVDEEGLKLLSWS